MLRNKSSIEAIDLCASKEENVPVGAQERTSLFSSIRGIVCIWTVQLYY